VPEQNTRRIPTDALDIDAVNDSSSRTEKQCLPEVRTTQIDVFLNALLDRHDKDGKNEPLEWVAATGIYITHVVDIIERNSRILRCE